jgi:hypothetical protein
MLAIVKCEDEAAAYKVEKLAHELFERQHKRGEWFLLGKNREKMLQSLAKKVAAAKREDPHSIHPVTSV